MQSLYNLRFKLLGINRMKLKCLIILSFGFFVSTASASDEPIDCYKIAWTHIDRGGFGLPSGLAVELCSGSKNAQKTLRCFAKAWGRTSKDRLGLTRGLAVRLCKSNSQSYE